MRVLCSGQRQRKTWSCIQDNINGYISRGLANRKLGLFPKLVSPLALRARTWGCGKTTSSFLHSYSEMWYLGSLFPGVVNFGPHWFLLQLPIQFTKRLKWENQSNGWEDLNIVWGCWLGYVVISLLRQTNLTCSCYVLWMLTRIQPKKKTKFVDYIRGESSNSTVRIWWGTPPPLKINILPRNESSIGWIPFHICGPSKKMTKEKIS